MGKIFIILGIRNAQKKREKCRESRNRVHPDVLCSTKRDISIEISIKGKTISTIKEGSSRQLNKKQVAALFTLISTGGLSLGASDYRGCDNDRFITKDKPVSTSFLLYVLCVCLFKCVTGEERDGNALARSYKNNCLSRRVVSLSIITSFLPFAFCLAGYIRNDRVHHHLNKKKNTPQRDESRRNVSA